MSIARSLKQGSVVLAVACSMAAPVMPWPQVGGSVAGSRSGLEDSLQEVCASAVGTILMPTTTELGILVAVGQTEDQRVFMLDTELTSFVPGLFDPHTRVAFGAIYGRLFEAPGNAGGKQAAFDGVVEGLWRMDKSLVGSYEALVYERDGAKGLQLVGRMQGAFRVGALEDSDQAVQGLVLGARSQGSKDRKGPFADAASKSIPYGDDVVRVRESRSDMARSADIDASSAARKSAAAGGVAAAAPKATKSPAPTYVGATKLRFKLVD